ncbi:hypothetical protein KUCAC02_025606 [Chaenocephalus aceratus]|uniref:Uncharacterized protein n=1 Tax=Chaenocephalus aceratus TaxID=36190 RepID=A0ACB9VU96_CHAAC|nr:hypothetical protein KUCAC02_025606 [Chaenocephalus aceratus]
MRGCHGVCVATSSFRQLAGPSSRFSLPSLPAWHFSGGSSTEIPPLRSLGHSRSQPPAGQSGVAGGWGDALPPSLSQDTATNPAHNHIPPAADQSPQQPGGE